MKLFEVERHQKSGALLKSIIGLYHAKPGDLIEIGIEGSRAKYKTRIAKIVTNDRLQDTDGNVFGRDGMVYRRSSWWLRGTKGKIVFAKHITVKDLEKELEDDKIRFLKKYNWEGLNSEKRDQIIKILGIRFSTEYLLK